MQTKRVRVALLDAGYCNGRNADALYDAKVSFVIRVHGSNKIFTEAVKVHRTGQFNSQFLWIVQDKYCK